MNVVQRENARQCRANDERNTPAPLHVWRMQAIERKHGEHQHGNQIDRHISRRETGNDQSPDEAALLLLRIFDGKRHRACVATAEEDAIDKPQYHEQPVGADTERLVAGQQRDQ